MILSRLVRFSVNQAPADGRGAGASDPNRVEESDAFHNTYAGAPSMAGLGRFYELEVRCRGAINPRTGYFMDIKTIDDAARRTCLPIIADACLNSPAADPARVLAHALPALNGALSGHLDSVRWWLTPHYSIEVHMAEPGSTPVNRPSNAPLSHALIRQCFDFAASHRLHCPDLSDDENRRLFGKCNNPRGHGHNYRVEPCVRIRLTGPQSPVPSFDLRALERITKATVIDRFDHTYLNEDVADFRPPINPSVENIAKVCFDLLLPRIAEASPDAELIAVTVWETEKTCATYPG